MHLHYLHCVMISCLFGKLVGAKVTGPVVRCVYHHHSIESMLWCEVNLGKKIGSFGHAYVWWDVLLQSRPPSCQDIYIYSVNGKIPSIMVEEVCLRWTWMLQWFSKKLLVSLFAAFGTREFLLCFIAGIEPFFLWNLFNTFTKHYSTREMQSNIW